MSTATADLIAEARRLEEEGRLLEAIEQLTLANRARPNGRIERDLVRLRRAAFEEIPLEPGLARWPWEAADPFPTERGIPEISRGELTTEVLAGAVVNHGSLIVRGLFDHDTAEDLQGCVEHAMVGSEAWEEGAKPAETLPWFARLKRPPDLSLANAARKANATPTTSVAAVDSPRTVFRLLEAFEGTGVSRVVRGYLGERPALSVKKWTLRRVPPDTLSNWHQDGAFLGPVRSINLWVALSRCGTRAPGIDIVARRLDGIVETGTAGALFEWSAGQAVVERAAGDAPIVRPEFEAGDALFFDELNLHRTGVSPGMTDTRYAIESWFFAPSSYPMEQIPIVL